MELALQNARLLQRHSHRRAVFGALARRQPQAAQRPANVLGQMQNLHVLGRIRAQRILHAAQQLGNVQGVRVAGLQQRRIGEGGQLLVADVVLLEAIEVVPVGAVEGGELDNL